MQSNETSGKANYISIIVQAYEFSDFMIPAEPCTHALVLICSNGNTICTTADQHSKCNFAGFNSGDMATNKTDSYVYALNAKWDVGEQGKIVADIAYQDSKNETSFFAIRTDRGPLDIDVDFNAGGGLPAYSFANQGVLTDASQWTVGNLFDSGTKNTGSALTMMLDGEYKWDDGFLRRINGGLNGQPDRLELWATASEVLA